MCFARLFLSHKIENEMKTYLTSDINKSAAIIAAGGSLVGLERQSHRTLLFVLEPQDRCAHLAHEFESGTLTVNARCMVESLKKLKDAVFTRLRDRDRDDTPLSRDAT